MSEGMMMYHRHSRTRFSGKQINGVFHVRMEGPHWLFITFGF